MSILYPDLLKNRVTDITVSELHKRGIRGLLLDVDNTLTTHGGQELDPAIHNWMEEMQRQGIALTVVSNGYPWRVEPFAKLIRLQYISFACKPFPWGFIRGARRLNLPRKACAAVGDQTFTDVLGSHLAGVRCIQVLPIALEDHLNLRIKRRLEKAVLDRYRAKRQK
jgi:HAD superfamily phosphatase (TIGR01668 family)